MFALMIDLSKKMLNDDDEENEGNESELSFLFPVASRDESFWRSPKL